MKKIVMSVVMIALLVIKVYAIEETWQDETHGLNDRDFISMAESIVEGKDTVYIGTSNGL